MRSSRGFRCKKGANCKMIQVFGPIYAIVAGHARGIHLNCPVFAQVEQDLADIVDRRFVSGETVPKQGSVEFVSMEDPCHGLEEIVELRASLQPVPARMDVLRAKEDPCARSKRWPTTRTPLCRGALFVRHHRRGVLSRCSWATREQAFGFCRGALDLQGNRHGVQ